MFLYTMYIYKQPTPKKKQKQKLDFNFIFYKMIFKLCRLTFNFHKTKTEKQY